jgi:hypothetical protein
MTDAAAPPPKRPESAAANPAELRADIDSGATGDKVKVEDPAAAPLGTDAEAAGAPMTSRETELDRRQETSRAAKDTRSKELVDNTGKSPSPALGLTIGAVVALVLIAVLAWLMLGR